MPRGKKNIAAVVEAKPIQQETTSGKVKIDSLLWQIRELCRKHNLQMWNKESLSNQIYQDLLFIYHIPKLMKDGILTLDKERIGDNKIDEVSYNGLLSLKEPELINASFKRLWKELQKCEIKDLFYGREFTMFAIEKKNPQRYLALLVDLFKYIGSIELDDYDSNAGYTYFKKDLNKAIAKTFGQFYTPNTVTSSVVKQVEPKIGEKVLDPSCGSCSFLAEVANYITKNEHVDMKTAFKDLYGIEVESNIYAEGIMNMFINFGVLPDMKKNIREKDALIELVSNDEQYDKIVANPPFGANASTFKEFYFKTTMEPPKGKGKKLVKTTVVNPEVKSTIPFPNVSESAILFFQLIIQKLKSGGKAGVVMSATIFNDGFKDMMKWFLETCNLEKIVINPAGTFKEQGTGIETFSFIFTKGSPTTKISVVMLGAEDVVVREISIEQIKDAGWKLQMKEEEKKDIANSSFEYMEIKDLFTLEPCNIQASKAEVGQYPFMTLDDTATHNTYEFDGTNLFISKIPSGTGSTFTPKFRYSEGKVNASTLMLHLVQKTDKVSLKYFYYYFKLKSIEFLRSFYKGAANKSLDQDLFKSYKFPLPPLETQQQIVAELDTIYENASNAQRMAVSIKAQMESVMKSVGMRGYERKKIGAIVSFTNGHAFKSDEFIDTGIPVVKIKNIKNNRLDFDNVVYVKQNDKLTNFIVKKTDIVISLTGELSGDVGINTTNTECYLNQRTARIDITSTNVIKKYVYYYTINNKFVSEVRSLSTGSAQPNVSTKDIENILIPLPPLEFQKHVVAIMESLQAQQKVLEKHASSAEENAKFVLDGFIGY